MRTILAVCALSVLLAGCANANDNDRNPPAQQNGNFQVQQTAPENRENENYEAITERLERIAESIEQVNSATVVVVGNTAIVGIDVDGNLDRSRVDVLKFTVAEALRQDPYGYHAIVTADVDINARLREIAADIRNGQPVAGFLNELGDIIGRIMPQLPSDLVPREEEAPNSSEDKRKLDKPNL